MRLRNVLGAMVLAAAAAATSTVAWAGTTVKAVRGSLAAAVEAGTARGSFHLSDVERDGAVFQRFSVLVRGLDAGDAADPAFEVLLDNGDQHADLGALHLFGKDTRGWLRFDTRSGGDAGLTDLRAFSGGTVRITLDGADVATGTLPSFVDPDGADQGSKEPTGTIALGYGTVVLGDTSSAGSGPVARVTAYSANSFLGVAQGISVTTLGLSRGGTYTVVLAGSTEDTLGTFRVSNFFGFGGLVLSSRRGDAIPGGTVSGLAGRGIEIRDASGAVVLAGTFPSLR